MYAEATKGANSPILVENKGDGHPMMILAVMIILVIFIFVIFAIFALKHENHHGLVGAYPQNGGAAYGDGYGVHASLLAHDNSRDNLREFGNLKYEIAAKAAHTDSKTAQYFYETQKIVDQSRFDNYKATKESEEKILAEVARAERERILQENTILRTVGALRPHTPTFSNIWANNEQLVGTPSHGSYGYNYGV
ncbi:MAG: hypothetical protein FWF50_01695 [Defluviitaleaceae bacterium]|nr:hypothetical protein [Defluviitaleaceae bacterium]